MKTFPNDAFLKGFHYFYTMTCRNSLFYLFTLILFFSSCKKDKEAPEVLPLAGLTAQSEPFFYGKIGGEEVALLGPGKSSEGYNVTGSSKSMGDTINFGVYSSMIYMEGKNERIMFEKGTLRFYEYRPEDELFGNFFEPGSYSFSPGAVDGVQVRWFDSSGQEWSTGLGNEQTGSRFVIKEINQGYEKGFFKVSVLAHINCNLYNGKGDVKELKEAVFVGAFSNQ